MIMILCQTATMCTWPKVLDTDEAMYKWSQWEKMEEQSQDPEGELYMKREGKELLVRVPTHMEMNFRTSTKRLNEVMAITSSIKNASQEQLDGLVGKVGMHLDKMGNAEINMANIGAQVLASTGISGGNPTSSGADITSVISDVKALMPEDAKDEADSSDDEDDPLPGTAAGDPAAEDTKKKKKQPGEWWARDEFLVKKETELEGLITTDEGKLQEPYEELRKEVEVPYESYDVFTLYYATIVICR